MSITQPNSHPISLLCVDDDIWVLETLKHYFEQEPDIALQTSTSAMEALDLLNSQHFDAIMCDYSMPDLNGVALLREIRSRGDNAIFIIFTGRRLANVAIETLNSGGNYYLQKGVDVLHEMPKVVGYIKNHVNHERTPYVLPPPAESPYYALVEKQLDPVCCFDKDGRYRYTNESFKRDILAGKPDEGNEGFFGIIPEDELPALLNRLKSLSEQNARMHIEHTIKKPDGTDTLYLWNYRVILDKSGGISGYTAQGINFSGIVRHFSRSPLPESPYYALVEHQLDPICCFDRDGKFSYTSTSFRRDFFSGKLNEGSDGYFATIPADERVEILTTIRSLSPQSPGTHIEHTSRTSDGSPVLFLWHYQAMTDDAGEITGYTAQGTSLSGILRLPSAQRSARESAATQIPTTSSGTAPEGYTETPLPGKTAVPDPLVVLADSVEHVPYPIFVIDPAGRIVAWNQAMVDLTGVAAEDSIGKKDHAYALFLYGDKRPMLIDYIFYTPDEKERNKIRGVSRDGDIFTGDLETVTIQGKPTLLWSKGAGIYDADGSLTAAVQSILVSTDYADKTRDRTADEETYIGGISSIVLKVTGTGMGAAIAGAIGSSVGGYGVYATNKRLFVIHNPALDARRNDSIQFGTFIMDELFGTTVDTRPRLIKELESNKVFEVWRKDITSIELKKPRLLAGYLALRTVQGDSFRVYIDHNKAFVHLEQLLMMFYPELLIGSTEQPLPGSIKTVPEQVGGPSLLAPDAWKELADSMSSVPYPIFAIDREGNVIAWNTAMENLTGIAAREILGKGEHAYAVPFYGSPRPMLIDYILMPPDALVNGEMPAITRDGDTFIGELENVTIRNKPMLMWGKGTGIYDNAGTAVAAIQSLMVSEPATAEPLPGMPEAEKYLGGISSITVKLGGEGVSGTIAGALGSTTGGYGVYATDQRLFVIHNPELDATRSDGISFGRFIIDELFGSTVDTRSRMIDELERHKIAEIRRKDITSIEMKKPMLLAGYITITTRDDETIRLYIDHIKAFTHIHQLLRLFYPEILKIE